MNVSVPNVSARDAAALFKPVGVVGAGIMGQGIAQLLAAAGLRVLLHDVSRERAEAALTQTGRMLDREAARGRISDEAAGAAKARIDLAADLQPLAGAGIVIEAIVEDLAAKQRLFQELEALVAPECILATNTSSLLVTAIASALRRPERACGLHFFNPVPLMKVVEVIPGVKSSPAAVDTLVGLVRQTGHAAVVAADMPGFLINHAGRGLYTEGLRIVSEGIASYREVDAILREGAGFRMGPFQLFDLTGLDVSFPVLQQIYRQFFEEPRFRPVPIVQRQHAAGLFGRKVGQGFYAYRDGEMVAPEPEPAPRAEARPVWVAPSDGGRAEALARRLAQLGLTVETGEKPGGDSILLTAPLGDDATTAALSAGLDPERSLAVDTLFGLEQRMTVMTTPVTRPECRDSLLAMLAAAGAAATAIHDSPGFVAQRTVATIVNIACDIAQQRIASPADIDLGVKAGLGYPEGPLAMGDRLGARVVLDVLDRMHAFYRDPRYRPSPWLKRRAVLGRPLTMQDT